MLERLDAERSNTDDAERPVMVGKIALVAVVGNQDGAHKVVADCFQGLGDIGYTIPAQGCTYWNGEARQSKDYNDLDGRPETIASATAAGARNAAHMANVLRERHYPPYRVMFNSPTTESGSSTVEISPTRAAAGMPREEYR